MIQIYGLRDRVGNVQLRGFEQIIDDDELERIYFDMGVVDIAPHRLEVRLVRRWDRVPRENRPRLDEIGENAEFPGWVHAAGNRVFQSRLVFRNVVRPKT